MKKKLVIEIDKKTFDYIMACSFVEDEAVVLNQSLEDRIKTLMLFDVLNAIKIGTPIESIIADIEAAKAKDKLCEYPYVRCVEIIKKAMGHEEKTMDEGNK